MKKRVLVSVFIAMFITVIMADVSSAVIFGPAVNLGPGVNTGDNERFPDVSSDDLDLYLSSDSDSIDFDIFLSSRPDTASSFGLPTNLGGTVNSTDFDNGPSISPNGLALFFNSNRPSFSDHDIWLSTRPTTSDVFGTPFLTGGAGVNTTSNDFAPDVHDSGLSMIFTSNRPGGSGDNDLYVAKRPVIGPWTSVFELASVNTIYNDVGGTISSDGLSLFFTSDRPGGIGALGTFDLYVATRPDLVSPFGPAVNMGAGVNSIYDDMAPSISSDGSTLYFDSNRSGNYDIYQTTAVPEPGTIALLGIGLAGLAGASARRKLKTKSRQ